jgi:hypothetical protein
VEREVIYEERRLWFGEPALTGHKRIGSIVMTECGKSPPSGDIIPPGDIIHPHPV